MRTYFDIGNIVVIMNYDIHFNGLIGEVISRDENLFVLESDGLILRDIPFETLELVEDDLK